VSPLRLIIAVGIVAAAVVAAATSAPGQRADAGASDGSEQVLTLLRDGRLLAISAATGEVTAGIRTGSRAEAAEARRSLALSADGRTLAVLSPFGTGRQSIFVVDPQGLRVTARIALPRTTAYQDIAIGPRSGRLYVFGIAPAPRKGRDESAAPTVTVVDPASRKVVRSRSVRARAGHYWYIFDALISADESYALTSYHGGCTPQHAGLCTTGADVVELPSLRRRSCTGAASAGVGCLSKVHGFLDRYADGALAATGSAEILRLDRSARVVGSYSAGIDDHLLQVAGDAAHGRVYVLAECLGRRGLSVIDAVTGEAHVIGQAASPRLCGHRIATAPSGAVVLAQATLKGGRQTDPRLLLLDPTRDQVIRTVDLPSFPLDVLALGR